MSLILNIATLLVLFAALGLAADLTVKNIRLVALSLKMKMFSLGIILGIMTTLPELSVGINASLEGAGSLSVGNILGGIVVIIGLVLGVSLLLNHKIDTEDNLKSVLPASFVILSPFLLGIDGKFGTFDGIVMVSLYVGLIYYLYRLNRSPLDIGGLVIIESKKIIKEVFFAILGVVAVMLISHWIIQITLVLLNELMVSKLIIGLLIFSIGTNLPEITMTLTSWRRKSSDLSLSHLISSAFTNILVLGLLVILHPITFTVGPIYYALCFFVSLVVILFLIFFKSDKSLSRIEGGILVLVYIVFLAVNLYLAGR